MPDNKLQIIIEAYDKTKAAFQELEKSLKGAEGSAKKLGDTTRESAKTAKGGIDDLESSFKKLVATLGIGISVREAIRAVELGVAAEQAEESLRLVASAAGESADRIIAAMRRATAETIDDSDLMQKAVKGLSLGLKGDELIAIAGAARTSARIIGKGIGETFEQIVDAVSTNMPRALKQMGLITTEQMKLFSEAVSKGAKEVQLLDIVLANAAKQQERFGQLTENNAEKMQQFKAFFAEKWEIFGSSLVYSIGEWIKVYEKLKAVLPSGNLNELGRPEFRGKVPPRPDWMKTEKAAGETPEQVMARWKKAIEDVEKNSPEAREKALAAYLRDVDARWKAEVERNEGIGQLVLQEQKWRDEALEKQKKQEVEYAAWLEDIKLAQVEGEAAANEETAKRAGETFKQMETAVTGWAANFSATLNDALWDADFSFGNIAKSFAKMITQMTIQIGIIQPLLKNLFGDASKGEGVDWAGLIRKGVGAIARAFGGGAASYEIPANNFDLMAKGGVFNKGLVPFGSGGLVVRPTIFPFAGGVGLMGEKGAEAIMPLGRTPGGDLGVKALGGGGITVNVHNNAGAEVTTGFPDGKSLEIYIERKTLDTLRRNTGAVADAWNSEATGGNRAIINTLRRLG
jgi:uncharacterized protein YjgD (DUF1641 family)